MGNNFDRAIRLARQRSCRLFCGQHHQHLKRRREHHAKTKRHQQALEEEDKEGDAKDREETTGTRVSRFSWIHTLPITKDGSILLAFLMQPTNNTRISQSSQTTQTRKDTAQFVGTGYLDTADMKGCEFFIVAM